MVTRVGGATRCWCDRAAAVAVLLGALAISLAAAPASSSLPGATEYRNPVYDTDFPDPFVIRVGDSFYGYATRGLAANIQIIGSTDLVTWTRLGNALPLMPEWTDQRQAWAPSIARLGGRYVLYYTVRERSSGLFCVSRAVADRPEGPFFDHSTEALVCQRSRGGTIDPSVFVDGEGGRWLLFKSDGIEKKEATRLWSQRLAPDGLSLVGPRHQLLVTDRAWEGPVIENPAMTRADGRHFLFYSGNRWSSADYAIGWAVCEGPAGPCHKPDDGPLITSRDHALGPGGADFFTGTGGGRWIAYHAWDPPSTEYPWGERSLRIDKVAFADGRPWVQAPSSGPVPFSFSPGPPPPPSPAPPPATASAPPPASASVSASPAVPPPPVAAAAEPSAPPRPAPAAGPAPSPTGAIAAPSPAAPVAPVAPIRWRPADAMARALGLAATTGPTTPAAARGAAGGMTASGGSDGQPRRSPIAAAIAAIAVVLGWLAWQRRWKEESRSSRVAGGGRDERSP